MLGPDLLLSLTRRYCEPHRHYHTIEHVANMLWRGRDLDLNDVQIAAIWYHDAIYDVPASDNEARSAALARSELTAAGWSPEHAERVARIVLETADHVPSTPDSAVVLDLDLASLASAPEVFDANTDRLRREYACFTDQEFDAGRCSFLATFLKRERIYHTSWGEELEARARANLERSLNDCS